MIRTSDQMQQNDSGITEYDRAGTRITKKMVLIPPSASNDANYKIILLL